MPPDAPRDHGRRAVLWTRHARQPLLEAAARLARLDVVGVGSPERGRSQQLAAAFDAEPLDDLRSALVTADADLLLLADAGDFGATAAPDDADAAATAHERGLRIVTLEPVPAAALYLGGPAGAGWMRGHAGGRPIDAIFPAPLLRHAPAFRALHDVLPTFGEPRALSIILRSRPDESSLPAALFAAADLLLTLVGEPESLHAIHTPPAAGRPAAPGPGETLRSLEGHLVANARFDDGRAAALLVSDHAAAYAREILLLGEAGQLRITDDGWTWLGLDGRAIDEHRVPAADAPAAAAVLADALNRLLDPAIPNPAPIDHATVLSTAQAALLSARTRQPESPATLRRLAQR